ncbi:MAG TPA: hypothetical protein ENK52_01490 [Saprospiraceae bacterium]|nr:hypothetical protein [Saprospiraceae bacterium]
MFGLFSNKKEKKQEKQDHPEFLKLVEKWDAFLYKMETRFKESLVNAKEALFENLEESDYDINPTMLAWQGIKSQLMAMSDKVDATFDDKVLPQMLEYKEHYELLDEGAKGTHLREDIIFKQIDRFEIELEGEISTRFYNHAVSFLNGDFRCTQCGGKIEVRKDIFHSHYVSCDYCNTVNTFTPSDKIAQIRWVVDNIAKLKALNEWEAMQNAENEFGDLQPPSEGQDNRAYVKAFEKREQTTRTFWKKYFTERAVYLPEYTETIEHDTDVKMKWFYEERKRELGF